MLPMYDLAKSMPLLLMGSNLNIRQVGANEGGRTSCGELVAFHFLLQCRWEILGMDAKETAYEHRMHSP